MFNLHPSLSAGLHHDLHPNIFTNTAWIRDVGSFQIKIVLIRNAVIIICGTLDRQCGVYIQPEACRTCISTHAPPSLIRLVDTCTFNNTVVHSHKCVFDADEEEERDVLFDAGIHYCMITTQNVSGSRTITNTHKCLEPLRLRGCKYAGGSE